MSLKTLKEFAEEDFNWALSLYCANPDDFYASWQFLEKHPAFRRVLGENATICDSCFASQALSVEVVKVDPDTLQISDEEERNQLTNIWLECGPWYTKAELEQLTETSWGDLDGGNIHDIDLDCRGGTFEQAIVRLAGLVMQHYGTARPPFRGNLDNEGHDTLADKH